MDLVTEAYRSTGGYPESQRYVLTPQSQRAAISVPSNIAEGMAKRSFKDRTRFFEIAQGSLSELDTQIELARRLGFVAVETYEMLMDLIEEIQRLLSGLIKKYS
ncbi:MAG: four helix bundle protein [Bacteroidetes bacterium]|jgi:four helix bundle protein|nr:four helix bundle protein [Bacteroidota bacterium]